MHELRPLQSSFQLGAKVFFVTLFRTAFVAVRTKPQEAVGVDLPAVYRAHIGLLLDATFRDTFTTAFKTAPGAAL